MLEGMRKVSQGWAGRIFMGLIMLFISLSFVVWGVGDIFRGFGSGKVAQVGGAEISTEAFRSAYQTQLQALQRQAKRAVTNDQARAMGLDRQVLNRLISEAILDDRALALGLALSEQEIGKSILNDPVFAGPDGKFDGARFRDLLRDNGYTEQSFAREQRRSILRQEIVEALAGKLTTPTALLEAVNRYRAETRAVEYFELSNSAAGEIPAPSDQDLQTLYEARKASFRAPEYRQVATLAIAPTGLAKPEGVSDADARIIYERVKGQRFGAAEKRELEQLVFPEEKAAAEALAKVRAGASLADVAGEAKLDIANLGTVARGDLFDKAIAEAGFALPQGGVSEPVKGQFGWALVRVGAISPESVKPFEEVAGEIKGAMALERARKSALELRDKIEDERTSGRALADAAKAAGLSTNVIESIDATGNDRTGAAVAMPEREALLKAVFASDVGADNDLISSREGGFVWFEVLSIDPTRERRFDEVKDQVAATWKDDEIAKRLTDKATEIVATIKGGLSFDDAAKAAGLEVKRDDKVRRTEPSTLPQGAVARVFGLPVSEVASAAGEGQSRIVFKILDSVIPPLEADSDVMKGLGEQLRTALTEDVLTQYLAALQGQTGVQINEAAVRAAVGGGDPGTF
jgi:peptidyl-prolyl cis-trans isomerase D